MKIHLQYGTKKESIKTSVSTLGELFEELQDSWGLTKETFAYDYMGTPLKKTHKLVDEDEIYFVKRYVNPNNEYAREYALQ